ncbi:MAG: cupin domain-containing protein [Bacteroidetes bacterium]|nr:cupin domain-containing protein [Bacteroidota bacterium]
MEKIEKSSKFSLNKSVQYAEQSVVSKTVIKRDTGTVTLFAFSKGEGLSTHSAPFDAMVYIVDGSASITIGDTLHELEAGESIIMPAGIPHGLQAYEAFKMMLIMIKGS